MSVPNEARPLEALGSPNPALPPPTLPLPGQRPRALELGVWDRWLPRPGSLPAGVFVLSWGGERLGVKKKKLPRFESSNGAMLVLEGTLESIPTL